MRINVAKIQKRITRRDDRVYKIINYDTDNAYPQRVVDICNGSGVAYKCLDIYTKFISGKGFLDKKFGDQIIDGKSLTADMFHRLISRDFAKGGFAVHVNYNVLGERTTFSHVPFAYCRLGIDEKSKRVNSIAVYDNWDRDGNAKIDKDKIDYINLYDPRPDVVVSEIIAAGGIEKYKGQIFYYGAEGQLIYPLAPFDSELEDIETDSQIKLYKYRNISGSFMASHMLITYGQFEDDGGKATTETDRKATRTTSNQEEEFVGKLKEFQGAENFNRLMHIEADNAEQKPELIPFTHQNNDKLFEYHETSTQSNIRKVFGIPTIFIEAIPGSMGLSQQLRDAVMFFNRITQDERSILAETYDRLFSAIFPGLIFDIQELDKFNSSVVDTKDVLDVVSANEKREMVGLPVQATTNDNIILAQKLGVGGTQSMMQVLVDALLTRDQKAGTLKVLFGLTEEQIIELLPLEP